MPVKYIPLSERILRGDSLKKLNNFIWLGRKEETGELCGCAIGGAVLDACGLEITESYTDSGLASFAYREAALLYPWLKGARCFSVITAWYHSVAKGEMTIEELVDKVRGLEKMYDERIKDDDEDTHEWKEGVIEELVAG